MRLNVPLLLSLTLLSVAMVAGCRLPAATTPAPPRPVKIVGYINVTSGCQQKTVDLLNSFPAKYPGVQVELVDFGDAGAGTERWHASGLKCMAIEIDGASLVKFPAAGQTKYVPLRAPAGFNWTHEDLEQAVQAALAGTLQPTTEEELATQGAPPVQTPQRSDNQPPAEPGS